MGCYVFGHSYQSEIFFNSSFKVLTEIGILIQPGRGPVNAHLRKFKPFLGFTQMHAFICDP